jgi:hypothetical protein
MSYSDWLTTQRVERFKTPVPLAQMSDEISTPPEEIRSCLDRQPAHHLWSGNKLYCLRLCGADHVCLDQEHSVIGAAEAIFLQSGFQCRREIGNAAHIERLQREPSFVGIEQGKNLIDLWALRVDGKKIDLWILEGKGKQAKTFDYYNMAYALGQVFSERPDSNIIADMLGALKSKSRPGPGRGLCWDYAHRLSNAWRERGFAPRITVGVLVPEWSPDIIWNGHPEEIESGYFSSPIKIFRNFVEQARSSETLRPGPKSRLVLV